MAVSGGFRGASAEAFSALQEELADDTTGAELFAVASVLRSEPSLRRVATDVSLPGEAKAGLAEQVFGSHLGAPALALVKSAAARRWTRGHDLADALENLGVIAVVKSAGDDAPRLEDELFAVGQTVKNHPELRDALSDRARDRDDKATLVHGLLDDKALPATITLVEQSLAGSYRTVGLALHAYQQIAAQVQQQSVATVRVAKALTDDERSRLGAALERQYDRKVHLNEVVEPGLIGGIRVEIGDDVIDGTVSSRLDDARRRLAG